MSGLHDVGMAASEDAAGIHDERGVLQHLVIVHTAVVGHQDDSILGRKELFGEGLGGEVSQVPPGPGLRDAWDMGVVIADVGAHIDELGQDDERRAFTRIRDVLLIGQAENQDLAVLDRFTPGC